MASMASSVTTRRATTSMASSVYLFLYLVITACVASVQDVKNIQHAQVTDEEIKNISEILYSMDENRAKPIEDYVVNIRGPRLFIRVNASLLRRPTYAKLRDVQGIYTSEIGTPETACPPCAPEENAFLDAILETSVMTKTHEFLANKGLAKRTKFEFRAQMTQWWLHKYTRSQGKAIDSSGFEHVFAVDLMGPQRSTVGGLHNWVYFYDGETRNTTTYGKYIESCKPSVLTCSYSFKGKFKPKGGFFLGTSPELELALNTLCFRARQDRLCHVSLDNSTVKVQTYHKREEKLLTISTAFPTC